MSISVQIADPRSSLAGATAWIISDGKAGHEVQCRGVAEALGLSALVKRIAPRGLFRIAAPWGPVSPTERFGLPGSSFAPPWPQIAFAAGRTTVPYIRALKQAAGAATFAVILLDPKTADTGADLIWVPEHDERRGPNVISTLTSPNGFSAARLAELRKAVPAAIAALPVPRVAVLIGGPNSDFAFNEGDAARLAAALGALSKSGAGLMISPSRRTPPAFLQAVDAATAGTRRILWTGDGENPFADFIAHADAFVVTADSVNMAGEAAATGKPVYVFTPERKRASADSKFAKYHDALGQLGVTRELPDNIKAIESWAYTPLDAAGVIAAEIRERLSKRAG